MDNPAFLWEWPPDGTTIMLNPAGCAELRMPEGPNQLADILAIMHQDDRGLFLTPYQRPLHTGSLTKPRDECEAAMVNTIRTGRKSSQCLRMGRS